VGTKKPNKVIHFPDGVTVIALERRDGTVLPCFIDTADYDRVKPHRWHVQTSGHTFYAQASVTGILFHRIICSSDEQVDHKDGNGLNNRRKNLRPATHTENVRNIGKPKHGTTSRYKGVSWDRDKNQMWRAQIRVNRKTIYLGRHTNEIDAARAYDAAALEHHGEFAQLNFQERKAA
jgi:hypothetical protein